MQPKYEVTKIEDGSKLEHGDFFVIRKKDVFAAAALYGYAHLISSALELAATLYSPAYPEKRIFTGEQDQHLSALRDACWEMAMDWSDLSHNRKIPD